ncbi:MAG TPA: hypothetical protein VF970_11325, partial [Gemmatimonadales bacterium]
MRALIPLATAVLTSTPLIAQEYGSGRSGPRALLLRDREIALARSAAPAALSDSATIYVLTATGYQIAVNGTNGAACYVSRDWPEALEPHCFDPEGTATVMPRAMRRVELLHQGRSPEEADREIAEGVMTGTFKLPRRPVVSYMLSGAQELISDDGRKVGAWKPHLMIYYPYFTAADAGLKSPADSPEMFVVDSGRPTASLIIVVPSFVHPASTEAARR